MVKKKVLVLTDTMPWGHRSIARAIYNYLKIFEKEDNLDIRYAEVKADTGVANDLYMLIYRFSPRVGKLFNLLGKSRAAMEALDRLATLNLKNLKKTIDWIKPDLIIGCYFFHSRSLAIWKEKSKKSYCLWTVVADPWTSPPASFMRGADLHLVYDEIEENAGMKEGVEVKRIFKTGWWVRPDMYKKYDKEAARKKLGFTDDRPVIFVGGGSLGTSSLTRILPALMLMKRKVGFVFNTGTDKLAFNLVEEYVRLFRRLKEEETVQIKNMGWIENIAEVLTACDLVLGKAGPNFLFDVVAVGKPFVSITHIGGQEDGNIGIIKKKKLGWVKERPGEAANFLLKYLEDNKKYEKMFQENIKAEAKRNQKSLEIVRQRIKQNFGK